MRFAVAPWTAVFAVLPLAGSLEAQTYVGSEECKLCHEAKYNEFRTSGHPFKLHTAADAMTWPIPLPEGYNWNDISYVIGGYGWKIRFMDVDGFIITDSGGIPGNNQYNLATGEWVDYHAGEVKPYDCGRCHTTGFSSTGSQGGLPGIVGSWAFEGIQCEACHGPASEHVASPSPLNITVDTSSAACGECHVRGAPEVIPASGGFIRHHEQYNELLASPHASLDCVSCHEPHRKSKFSIHTTCTDCHPISDVPGLGGFPGGRAPFSSADQFGYSVKFSGIGRKHAEMGVDCVDCHMPFAAKTAVKFNTYKADIRSHLFDITTNKQVEMFDPTGTQATGVLVGEYVCLGCHQNVVQKYEAVGNPEKAVDWARKGTKWIH